MNGKIYPLRITEARESRALSMGDLADSVGVTRQSISKYENGINAPSPDVLQSIASVLDFPVSFFYKEESISSGGNSALFFRSNANIAKKVKTACNYQIKWADEVRGNLSRYVDFPSCGIPTIDANYEDLLPEDIENLALDVRRAWGLNDDPVSDLIGLLENRGAIVARFPSSNTCSFKGIDAFSAWKNGTPYILYHPVQKSAVRTRFSLLHELGHLILHSSIPESDSTKKNVVDFADQQADRFAAAFLLPSTSFPKDIHSTSINSFVPVKQKWGVSLSTIIRRCETLGILSENQINYLRRQMTMNRYWHKEPLDETLTIRSPEIIRDAVMLLLDNNIVSISSLCNSISLSPHDLQTFCELPNDIVESVNIRKKPQLRVIS